MLTYAEELWIEQDYRDQEHFERFAVPRFLESDKYQTMLVDDEMTIGELIDAIWENEFLEYFQPKHED